MEPEEQEQQIEITYSVAQVAVWLHMSERTVKRLVKSGAFEFYRMTPHAERPRIIFTQRSIDAYISKYGSPTERPKRAYHRTVKKYARTKKPKKKAG